MSDIDLFIVIDITIFSQILIFNTDVNRYQAILMYVVVELTHYG